MSGADQVPPDGAADDGRDDPSSHDDSAGLDDRQYPAPSERTWIHPAELPSTRAVTPPPPPPRRWVTIPLGIAASLMLLAGITLLVVHPASRSHSPSTALASGGGAAASPADRSAARALVAISEGATSTVVGDGVTLTPSTFIATSASLSAGSTIQLTSATGATTPAHVLGTDTTTGVSVISADHAISTPALVAPVPQSAVDVTDLAMTTPLSHGAPPSIVWLNAMVAAPVSHGTPDGSMLGVLVASDTLSDHAGNVLVDASGAMVGLATPKLGANAFLPSELVSELAHQLESTGAITHARLGITGKSAPAPGATVVSVEQGGPAAGVLVAGDTITAIGPNSVTSMPDMLDELYGLPAASSAEVSYLHNGAPERATLTLGTAP